MTTCEVNDMTRLWVSSLTWLIHYYEHWQACAKLWRTFHPPDVTGIPCQTCHKAPPGSCGLPVTHGHIIPAISEDANKLVGDCVTKHQCTMYSEAKTPHSRASDLKGHLKRCSTARSAGLSDCMKAADLS